MASLSRIAVYGALAIGSIALLWATGAEPAKGAKTSTKTKPVPKSKKEPEWNFDKDELAVRFESPAEPLRNIFKALIVDPASAKAAEGEVEELTKLPAAIADGESDWAYTGMVEVDGKRLALLENLTTHQGGYVREGETWKKARIVRISLANVVFADVNDVESTVFRYNANAVPKVKPLPDSGFRPIDLTPALKGPIGLELKPTAPVQKPLPTVTFPNKEIKNEK